MLLLVASANAEPVVEVGDEAIEAQRARLATASEGVGFGPQAPRDLTQINGENPVRFGQAPERSAMTLCNIHFHESAEHRGGEFTTYAGNGDGAGFGTGYLFDGPLSDQELAPVEPGIGDVGHGDLQSGDTIEVHFVHTTARVEPGPTLGACLSEAIGNPQLRVEAQVYVLVNDRSAADFTELVAVGSAGGRHQAVNMPTSLGTPIIYAGSTTGPGYNVTASPFQVTWSVWPTVLKVDIASVAAWLADNPFDEDHAHGVRNLVTNPALLSTIGN